MDEKQAIMDRDMPQKESGLVGHPTVQGIERPYIVQGDTLRSKLNNRADRLKYKVAQGMP